MKINKIKLLTLNFSLFTVLLGGCATTRTAQEPAGYDPRAYFHYSAGALKEHGGLVDDAIREYETALVYTPREPVIHRHLAVLYQKKGMRKEALNEFT